MYTARRMPYSEKFSAIDATFSVLRRRWYSMQSSQNSHRKSCFYPCSASRNVLQRFISCRYSSSVRLTTELAVLENASPNVRQQAGSSGRDTTPGQPNACITSSCEMVTPSPLRTNAMSQLFFSLSVSMGIMITYGSYVKPDVDLNKAVNQIEIFDTGVALLAGAMIIPAVYVFSGTEGMSAGPSLMFVSLPKVFAAMGKAGTFVGILFFVTAIFATLTSCISVLESITANCMEIFHSGRKKTVLVLAVIYLAASAIIALGYSIFYFEVQLPNGSAAQLLDIMDYVSNSVMMPFIALLSTILIGWVMTPDYVIDEMQRNGETFRRKKLYRVMIRYVAPVMMLVLFLQSTGILA